MKKYIAFMLAFLMIFSVAGCKHNSAESSTSDKATTNAGVEDDKLKVGFILPAEADAPDTETREDAIHKMQNQTGLTDSQIITAENISKDECADTIKEMEKKGCQIIFALGSRYEEAVMEAAQEDSDIQFCIEGGRDSITSGIANLHTFNSRIYEAYYAEGVVAGMKINDMLNRGDTTPGNCDIGFVAYNGCPETSSCINAFYLGVKTVTSQADILVRYVGKRGNYDMDGEAAKQLAESGDVCMMASYTYTTAVAAVCAEYGLPVFGNEENIINVAPKRAVTSTYTDWSKYYIEAVNAVINGSELASDWCGGYQGGVVYLSQLNDQHLVDGTVDKLKDVEKDLRNGKIKIFDTEKFTVDGEALDKLVKDNDDFKIYADYVSDGELKEQVYISAPVFQELIDGVSISLGNYLPEEEESTEEDQSDEESTESKDSDNSEESTTEEQ